jgi:MFS family permease
VALALEPDANVDEEAGQTPRSEAGHPTGRESAPLSTLLLRIKTSCFATFAYGYFQASVVLFLPLYLIEAKGVAREKTILVTFFFALGMLLFSNVAGRLGDKYGHLLIMRILGIVGTTMVLGFIALSSFALMAIAVFVAGATLASISPVSLALQGIVTEPRDYNRSNAIYNAFYALGMLGGPRVSSLLFARWGGGAMLLHLAVLWVLFVLFTVVFWRDDPAARSPSRAASPLPVS